MSQLFSPDDHRHLHFLGIGGAGMSALALAARRRGIAVVGGDNAVDAFSDLEAAGAEVYQGSDPTRLADARALVYTAAAAPDHPMLVAARAAGIETVPRKVALAGLIAGRTVVALAGTHGKTTTTVMTTLALQGAGLNPSALAGGRVPAWGGNAWLDGDDLWVVEADEYDQAFLTLTPTVAVINNVEADHLECYGTVADLEAAFVRFAGPAATVLIGTADAGSDRVAALLPGPIRFGFEVEAGLHLTALGNSPAGSDALVRWPDGHELRLRLGVPGAHNLRNAAGALGAVRALEGDVQGAANALAGFTGVGRRFERGPEVAGIAFVDDYAHHPTEVVATLAAARQAYPDRRLVAVFQPHLYSRTREHHAAMGAALRVADVAVVTDVYPAREAPLPGVTGELVAESARRGHARVLYQPDRADLDRTVVELIEPGDLVLTLGAGDVTRVGPAVRALLVADA
ncbi:MAG TPA: UDP-N-acetylmuramate--L-alanine ligase [Gemmatimonadales bacterium]|nr:UDP-N-acetylmuramate--L-alanine ligase [Gemmatimonadales bacterium]